MKSLFEKERRYIYKSGRLLSSELGFPNGNYKIGRYGRARRQYLKEYKKSEYTALIISGKLHSKHLHDVDVKAQKIIGLFYQDDAEKTAPDKATHQMEWVGHMNNAKACAEEVINHRLIYASR